VSILECLREEIECRKQEAVEILRHHYSDEEIQRLCTRLVTADESEDIQEEFSRDGHPPETFFAVVGFCALMHLERNIPPAAKYKLSAESAADLILTGCNAMLSLVEAGWKPSERYTNTRLAQLRNQPKTRQRENVEHDDINEQLEFYLTRRGTVPKTLDNFLDYLELKGYVIDEAEKTVNSPAGAECTWREIRKFGTIENWLREFRKAH